MTRLVCHCRHKTVNLVAQAPLNNVFIQMVRSLKRDLIKEIRLLPKFIHYIDKCVLEDVLLSVIHYFFSFPGLPCRHRCASSFLPSSSTASWCVDWCWSSIREGDWFLHSRSFKQCRKTWKVRYFFIINFFNFCRLTLPLISTNQLKSFVILAVLRRSVLRVYGAHLWFIALEQHSSFRRNVTPEASCWQHCIWFYRPEIWTSRYRDERVSARPIGGAWQTSGMKLLF